MNPATPPDLTTAAWRKSTRSSGGGSNCVEVARLPGLIAIRDSKNPQGATLIISSAAFEELANRIRRGTAAARVIQIRVEMSGSL
jgi:phosphoserine phosphatase